MVLFKQRPALPVCAGFAAIGVLLLTSAPVWPADPVAEFYSGKTIKVLVGFGTGGGYDVYARTLARYMGRYIPGNPPFVVQNMPGAGGLKAVNYLYGLAPKDGTVLATFARGIVVEPLLSRAEGTQFDAAKFTWIGSIANEVSVCAFHDGSGIKTWRDMQTKSYVIGASGSGADSNVFPTVLRNMFHLPMRIVAGYSGGADLVLAVERHEIDGRCGWSWTSLLSRNKALLTDRQINVTLQLALQKHEDLAAVPLVMDLIDDPNEKAALRLIVSRQSIARPFAAPPGIPADRARALRDAFDATMKDADFLHEAAQLELEVRPVTGIEVQALINDVYASPAPIVKRASEVLQGATSP
jgi:tripartite-type tricarboxylate transporter receptor subunit TctC